MSGNVGNASPHDRTQIYRDHARNASENFNTVIAANQELHLHVEEAGEAIRQAREENDQLRALNRRAAIVLREHNDANRAFFFSLAVVVIVGIVAALFFTGFVPLWALALALGLGAVSLIAYWGYEWYAQVPSEPANTISYSATPLATPGAHEARDSWLDSLRRLYV